MIATFRYVGTVGFIMYVADAFGYVGSVGVLFLKEFSASKMSYMEVLISGGYIISIAGSALILSSMWYFHRKYEGYRVSEEIESLPALGDYSDTRPRG
jgi:hypothetical protein